MEKLSPSVTRVYPSYRDSFIKNGHLWLAGRRKDDNAEGLWRIYDKLYDLSNFMDIHPGGKDWLEMTKGLDITELFETHHISGKPEKLLQYYFVRETSTPRNSKLTFAENGFFKTLKRKIAPKLTKSGSWKSKALVDTLLFITVALVALTGRIQTGWMCLLTAISLTFTVIGAHNFLHQRDNWRMKIFNLSLMSYRDWRISHVLSHHQFPNTLTDLEITYLEPFLLLSAYQKKNFLVRYGAWLYSLVLFSLIYFIEFLNRVGVSVNKKKSFFHWDEVIIPLSIPVVLIVTGAEHPLKVWLYVMMFSSTFFGFIGIFSSMHHSTEVFHEGDEIKSYDFGEFQLRSVGDRKIVRDHLLLVLTHFGNHGLHHLFPSLDHAVLPKFKEDFLATCKEFNIELLETTFVESITGYLTHLARLGSVDQKTK